MALGGAWSRLTSFITGAAIGGAAADSVSPVLEAVKQHANAQRAIRVLEPRVAAELAAERFQSPVDLADDAKRQGVGVHRFAALVELERTAPGTAQALLLWRRGAIERADVVTALHKARVREEFVEPLLTLFDDRLDPAVIATAVQRGILSNPNLLPVGPPAEQGKVPPMPTVELDPLAEAQAGGMDFDRLAVLTRIVGLPASPDLAARMVYRGIIERVDFDRAVSEGNTRNEWAPFLFEGFREIATVHEYVQARLRAWIGDDELHAGAARHGMSVDDVELLLKVQGRPLSWHQVFIGLRRGGQYDGPVGELDAAFLKSLEESDIRPEWYNLAWAQRYSYPSAFVLRALTTAGELTEDEAHTILLNIGWPPDLAAKVSHRWAASTGGSAWAETRTELADEFEAGYMSEADYRAALAAHGVAGAAQDREVHLGDARRAKRFREKVVDAIGAAYVAFKLGDTEATSELAEVGVLADAAGRLLHLWGKQRMDAIRLLTPAQVKKAYTKGLIDQQTAHGELVERGYTDADASLFLAE